MTSVQFSEINSVTEFLSVQYLHMLSPLTTNAVSTFLYFRDKLSDLDQTLGYTFSEKTLKCAKNRSEN
jgi:hypothetical protein